MQIKYQKGASLSSTEMITSTKSKLVFPLNYLCNNGKPKNISDSSINVIESYPWHRSTTLPHGNKFVFLVASCTFVPADEEEQIEIDFSILHFPRIAGFYHSFFLADRVQINCWHLYSDINDQTRILYLISDMNYRNRIFQIPYLTRVCYLTHEMP